MCVFYCLDILDYGIWSAISVLIMSSKSSNSLLFSVFPRAPGENPASAMAQMLSEASNLGANSLSFSMISADDPSGRLLRASFRLLV